MQRRKLANKVALISGSSMGIGKALARDLCRQGVKVIINGRDARKLYQTEQELLDGGFDVNAFQADIRSPQECRELVDFTIRCHGYLDILVNNAAIGSRGSVEEIHPAVIRTSMDTNYMGPAFLSKFAIPYLKKSGGSLIFISSVGGLKGFPYNCAYSASKMALTALADGVRMELYDDDVHVGIAYVGFTENDPRKTILDIDGSKLYLPKRTNVRLASQASVARRVRNMIVHRKNRIVLTRLGLITEIISRYFPYLADWYIKFCRESIKIEYTMIGGKRIRDRTTVPVDS